MDHAIMRRGHELKRWRLIVQGTSCITSSLIRILFKGEALADFTSLGATAT